VYGPRLPDTLRVIGECGFTFTTELFTWIKEGEFVKGKTTRKGVENMWGTKRGKGVLIRDHSIDQRVIALRGEHSRKPDEVYHRLERLYGDVRRLELFGTKLRDGWTVWGHIEGSEFVRQLQERGLL
jgi:N6-adenosine-specific RNA methylase IME4